MVHYFRLLFTGVLGLSLLVWCPVGSGSTVHNITWSIEGVALYWNTSLEAYAEDTILFHCVEQSYSNIISQPTQEQFEHCNASKGEGQSHVVGECFGDTANHSLPLRNASGTVDPLTQVKMIYFTSYSNGSSTVSGGECLQGLKLAVRVSQLTTVQPSPAMTPKTGLEEEGDDNRLSIAAIAGLCAGGAAIMCALIGLLGCWKAKFKQMIGRRRRRSRQNNDDLSLSLTSSAPPGYEDATSLSTLNRYYYYAGEDPPIYSAALEFNPSESAPHQENSSQPLSPPVPSDQLSPPPSPTDISSSTEVTTIIS